ncbi:carbon-monoxide dehydrogenase, catalytic subunit [Desulfotomaculum nigrificans CO-1-SRB]|uniref:Carbon monoxide dehydrogenase n=1 Tax=Desulfotomaculum nigrificans (strain DSM 14880 / VKM B-2319 / CO-1-SRB) TaxID=868595 RepID=F6B6H4_DESCC|nr:anaerobic carbon-monoxide dehydrogenase catalytic subunit [Desulfotomaculum nigrificans]AEF93245.1 carbon-monoxide dehydrogenase, catalytic subunit [Desulfotomaculum nigrificans CO-1-SRB]
MSKMKNTIDPAVNYLLPLAKKAGIETVWDRFAAMKPQCGFGELGVCCRICWKGPCRIDPFGNGPQRGVCGADANTIVARNLARMIAGGAASHSDHGRHIALTLLEVGEGHAPAYRIKDEQKLRSIAEKLNLAPADKDIRQVAKEVALASLEDYSRQNYSIPCNWTKSTMTAERVDKLLDLGIMPHNIDAVIAEIMARTHVGCDADAANILLGGLKGALADYNGMCLSTELSDVLFGTPEPVVTTANLGVLKEDAVNIAVHGHNPLLSEIVCDVALKMNEEAKKAGAKEGINIVGICCTGNEVMMRRGIPLATNYLSQEMAIITGAVDAMVVDVQCIMPAITGVAECFHTEIITTMPVNKITGATHIEFREDSAIDSARKIVELAIDAFKRRDRRKVNIPDYKQTAIAGFSAEAIMAALSKIDAKDPLKPLIDNIINGNIQGIALFAGCNNPRTTHDNNFMTIAKELAKNNVLILATGCGAGTFAKNGLMTQEATEAYAGDSLKAVLTTIGKAAGLNGPLPLVLHMGSCVDNSRAVNVAVTIANKLGVDLDKLPLVASAPEFMSEKAVAIGTWAVALGLPTHIGIVPQIMGSSVVVEFLTEKAKDLLGGYFIVETDPKQAAAKLVAAIKERRKGLGI